MEIFQCRSHKNESLRKMRLKLLKILKKYEKYQIQIFK